MQLLPMAPDGLISVGGGGGKASKVGVGSLIGDQGTPPHDNLLLRVPQPVRGRRSRPLFACCGFVLVHSRRSFSRGYCVSLCSKRSRTDLQIRSVSWRAGYRMFPCWSLPGESPAAMMGMRYTAESA